MKHFLFTCGTLNYVLLWSAAWWFSKQLIKRQKKARASCRAFAVSPKLFKFAYHILLAVFSAANCSFEPTCHSAIRSASMLFQRSLRWVNIHAARPCSAFCLCTQTGPKQHSQCPSMCHMVLCYLGLQMVGLTLLSPKTYSPDNNLENIY